MQHQKARTRSTRVRRAGILLALAGLAVAALAMFPSGASAGAQPISLTVNATGTGDGTISGTADTSAGIVNINCSKNGGIILGCGQNSLADNEGQVVVTLTATPGREPRRSTAGTSAVAGSSPTSAASTSSATSRSTRPARR